MNKNQVENSVWRNYFRSTNAVNNGVFPGVESKIQKLVPCEYEVLNTEYDNGEIVSVQVRIKK